jgi:hypothetical protein
MVTVETTSAAMLAPASQEHPHGEMGSTRFVLMVTRNATLCPSRPVKEIVWASYLEVAGIFKISLGIGSSQCSAGDLIKIDGGRIERVASIRD